MKNGKMASFVFPQTSYIDPHAETKAQGDNEKESGCHTCHLISDPFIHSSSKFNRQAGYFFQTGIVLFLNKGYKTNTKIHTNS